MKYLELLPIIIIMVFIDTLITMTVASSTMLFSLQYGLDKNLSLAMAIACAIIVTIYIRFNHKIRNKFFLKEGDK